MALQIRRGPTAHRTAKTFAEGELIYTRSNDDNIDIVNDNQEENYRDYFVGMSDGEFIIDDNGRLVFVY